VPHDPARRVWAAPTRGWGKAHRRRGAAAVLRRSCRLRGRATSSPGSSILAATSNRTASGPLAVQGRNQLEHTSSPP
jgi:hypothetical protein